MDYRVTNAQGGPFNEEWSSFDPEQILAVLDQALHDAFSTEPKKPRPIGDGTADTLGRGHKKARLLSAVGLETVAPGLPAVPPL